MIAKWVGSLSEIYFTNSNPNPEVITKCVGLQYFNMKLDPNRLLRQILK